VDAASQLRDDDERDDGMNGNSDISICGLPIWYTTAADLYSGVSRVVLGVLYAVIKDVYQSLYAVAWRKRN